MNRIKLLLVSISMASIPLAAVSAQEPPLPSQRETPSPGSEPGIPEISVPSLLPNASASPGKTAVHPRGAIAPELSQLDQVFKETPLTQAAQEYRLHIAWRELQNRTAHDPEVVAAKEATKTVRTDLEKRAKVRAYYNIFYAHMLALAETQELKNYLNAKKAAVIAGWAQPRVRPEPTASLSPTPTPSTSPGGVPSAER